MRQTTGIIFLEFLTGAVLFVGMIFGLIAWRLISGPVDLEFAKPDIESALTRAREGRAVEIGGVSLQWLQSKSRFQIIATDLEFFGETGEIAGSAERALIDFSAASLLSGRPELSSLQLESGNLAISRLMDGEINVADHTIPAVDPFLMEDDANPVRLLELSLLNLMDRISQTEAVRKLETVSLRDFSVALTDEPLKVKWNLDDVTVDFRRDGQWIGFDANGNAYGSGAPRRAEVKGKFNPHFQSLSATLSFLDQSLADFPVLQLSELTISGNVAANIVIQLDAMEHGFNQVSFSMETGPGELTFGEQSYRVGRNDITLHFDVDQDSLVLDARELDIGPVSGAALIELDDAIGWFEFPFRERHPVSAAISLLKLNLKPVFTDVWEVENATLSGLIDLGEKSLIIDYLSVGLDEAELIADGRLYLATEPVAGNLPFGLQLSARSNGIISPDQVLDFWPLKLGGGARDWVSQNVKNGKLLNAELALDLKPDSLRGGHLPNESLKLDFGFSDAEVSFLSDLPSVMAARGQAQLMGNAFSLDVEEAFFSRWNIDSGSVQLTRFHPGDGELIIRATGSGGIQDIVRTVSSSRLELEEKHGLNVSALAGKGDGVFTYRRRLGTGMVLDDSRFAFAGNFQDGSFSDIFSDLDLTHSFGSVEVDNTQIAIIGYGQVDKTPIEFNWTDRFSADKKDRTRLTASGSITPDLLNRFGIAVRAYLSGDVMTRLRATGPSIQSLTDIQVDFDLTDNRLDLSELGWVKPTGERAEARLQTAIEGDDRQTNIQITANGFVFSGDLDTDETGNVDQIVLHRLFLENQLDLKGSLSRTLSGGLIVDVSGPYLNASTFLDGLLNSGSEPVPIFGQVSIRSSVDQLNLKEGLTFGDVSLALDFSGPILDALKLDGKSSDGGPVSIEMSAMDNANDRRLVASVQDAGGLFHGLFGGDFVQGGSLKADGILRPEGEESELLITVSNTRLKGAPLLTQILSLASLRGLTDVMSGDGILFTNVQLPLRMTERGYYFEGVKASGPAMGLTANGHILDDGGTIALDGVLVPSFGVNSALGGIPIFGDLFVSRQGEGVFAITYDVRGSMKEARVSVNPLSGLLPGVLRRIFENPTEAPLPVLGEATEHPAEAEAPAE